MHNNGLGSKTGAELAEAFAAIPATVTFLNLKFNDLGNKTGAELAQAFAAIPATVTSLNLRDNELQNLSVESIRQLRKALLYVQTIYLSEAEIKAMEYSKHYSSRLYRKSIRL